MHNAIVKQFWTGRLLVNHGHVPNIKGLRIILLIIWQIAALPASPRGLTGRPARADSPAHTGIPRPSGRPLGAWPARITYTGVGTGYRRPGKRHPQVC